MKGISSFPTSWNRASNHQGCANFRYEHSTIRRFGETASLSDCVPVEDLWGIGKGLCHSLRRFCLLCVSVAKAESPG